MGRSLSIVLSVLSVAVIIAAVSLPEWNKQGTQMTLDLFPQILKDETVFRLKELGKVHIEQGPVLEAHGIPLGVVVGIAGQTRLRVTVKGSQGHAGTVPMSMRKDPMPAAAEAIVLIEKLCKNPEEHLYEGSQCQD